MTPRTRFLLVGALVWVLLSALIGLGLANAELTRLRDAFDTEARIAHRLLSQRAAQHDAILATLNLLQPGADGGQPQQRLPAVYPQVLAVLQRERGGAWPEADLQAADAQSRALGRAVPVRVDLAQGRCVLLQHGEPASHALRIDLRAMVPWSEWPIRADGPQRVSLQSGGQAFVLQPGRGGSDTAPWPYAFRKVLASPSQPFDVVVERGFGWADLPWGRMAGASGLIAAVLAAAAAWWRQRIARRRAEELLRLGQVARLNTLGELAAGIAHELNQPLTAVLASTQAARRLLADEDHDPADIPLLRQALDQAAAQARRASDVLHRLRRSVERPDAGRVLQPVALDVVVADTLHLLEPESARRAVVPQVLAAAVPVVVQGDAVAVQQIVHNLVMNALQALEQVGTAERRLVLTLTLDTEGEAGRLRVADTGPGIPADALPRLFEPFFTTRPGGLGLGLSLCESLAQGMGGALAAEANPPRGACFTLRLPLMSD
jgi:signal transduction histidine kinase